VLLWSCHQREKLPTYADSTAITIPGVDSIDSVEVYNLANPVYNSGKWIKTFATMDTMPTYSRNTLNNNTGIYSDKVFIIFAKLSNKDTIDSFTRKYLGMDRNKFTIHERFKNKQEYAAQLEMKVKGYDYKAFKNFVYRDFMVFVYLEVIEEFKSTPRDSILARHAYFKDVEVRLK
jgi:hypothetical protein